MNRRARDRERSTTLLPTALLLFVLLTPSVASAATAAASPSPSPRPPPYEDARMKLTLTPRSPEQIIAFYSARKFPAETVAFLSRQCFIGVGLLNKSDQKLWLELGRWRFTTPDGELKRHQRDWLWTRLDAIQTPAAKRATLRWTLLPEHLDFHPGEREGGNILLPMTRSAFTLQAAFATGANGDGPDIQVTLPGLRCLGEPLGAPQ